MRRDCERTTGGTRETMDQPTAEQALRHLESLVGEWTVEAKWPDGEAWAGGGKVTFEWHASRAHLVERGTVELPEAPDNVSIIGCDAANGTYFQLYSDERGVCRVYEMSIGNGESGSSRGRASRSLSASPRPLAMTGTRSPDGGRSPKTAPTTRPTSTSSTAESTLNAGFGRESVPRCAGA
jgi:hypothetical protein